jgi:hypothetical protein
MPTSSEWFLLIRLTNKKFVRIFYLTVHLILLVMNILIIYDASVLPFYSNDYLLLIQNL